MVVVNVRGSIGFNTVLVYVVPSIVEDFGTRTLESTSVLLNRTDEGNRAAERWAIMNSGVRDGPSKDLHREVSVLARSIVAKTGRYRRGQILKIEIIDIPFGPLPAFDSIST
jgi:hypothetical protein